MSFATTQASDSNKQHFIHSLVLFGACRQHCNKIMQSQIKQVTINNVLSFIWFPLTAVGHRKCRLVLVHAGS